MSVRRTWYVIAVTATRRRVDAKAPVKGPMRSVLCRVFSGAGGFGAVEQAEKRKPAVSMERARRVEVVLDIVADVGCDEERQRERVGWWVWGCPGQFPRAVTWNVVTRGDRQDQL